MKILILGDMHWTQQLPYGGSFKDGRKEEWSEVIKKIVDTAQTCDAVVQLGDFYHARHNHSMTIKDSVKFLKSLGDKEINILAGNHSRYGTNTALDFLKEIGNPNWHVHTEPTETSVAGVPSMMIPFMTPASLGVEDKESGAKKLIELIKPAKLAFTHHAISGSKVRKKSMNFETDFFNEIVLPKEDLEEKFDVIVGGHIHEKQWLSEKTLVAGSVFPKSIGEHEKSIWVMDTEGGKIEEVELPVRGIYKMIWEEDMIVTHDSMVPKKEIPKNSIVKCYVTNRGTNLNDVKEYLNNFDSHLIIEQYPSERAKTHFEVGGLDLSVEGLLKLYSKAKELSYSDLKSGFDLIKE